MRSGLVRRIDDLGRVVIPREIRRELRIKEGDPLEMWVDGKQLRMEVYRSYARINNMQPWIDSVAKLLDCVVLVVDRTGEIEAISETKAGSLKKHIGDDIDEGVWSALEEGEPIAQQSSESYAFWTEEAAYGHVLVPIRNSFTELLGGVIAYSRREGFGSEADLSAIQALVAIISTEVMDE